MYEIQDLMRILGWTEHQVRVRLDEFRSILTESLRRGDHNRLLLDGNGLAILQRIKELETRGYTLKQIKTQIETELRNSEFVSNPSEVLGPIQTDRNDRNRVRGPDPSPEQAVGGTDAGSGSGSGSGLGLLVEELRRQVEAWRQEAHAWRAQAEAKDRQITELLSQLKELQQKALPPARSAGSAWQRFWRRLRAVSPPNSQDGR